MLSFDIGQAFELVCPILCLAAILIKTTPLELNPCRWDLGVRNSFLHTRIANCAFRYTVHIYAHKKRTAFRKLILTKFTHTQQHSYLISPHSDNTCGKYG